MPTRSVPALILVLTLVLALGACGDEGGDASPGTGTPPAGTGTAEAPRPLEGRDGAGVLELLPGDARDVLEGADRIALLALHPYPGEGAEEAKGEPFHGYTVLGRADVPEAEHRKLVQALYRGLNANNDMVASCFNPRHGLRIEAGERTIDLVICFECLQIEAHGADPTKQTDGLTSRDPEPTLDALLKQLGLPKHRDDDG